MLCSMFLASARCWNSQ